MKPIFLVVGPPAVGKSTISRALAAQFHKSVHIAVDDLRDMVVSGLVLPSPTWSDDLAQQITLARESAIHMALNYNQAGFAVAIDDFVDPNRLSEYQALRSHPHFYRVVLYPTQSEAHRRNLERAGMGSARDYIDEGIRMVYQQLGAVVDYLEQDGWMILDTSTLSVEDTVSAILDQWCQTMEG